MKELILSDPSSFGNHPDCNLLDSIAEDDQVSLLPIIRMAFPLLEGGMLLQPFPPNDIAFSLQPLHSMVQGDDGIMQKDNEHSLPLERSKHALVWDCGLESVTHRFIQNVDENMQIDESVSTSSISAHGFRGQHLEDIRPHNVILPAHTPTPLRQQNPIHGLECLRWQPPRTFSEANELSNAGPPPLFQRKELLYAAQRAEVEHSFTTRVDKLSLSLGSTCSETDLQVNRVSSKTNLLCCPSRESSLLQQVVSKPSEGVAFAPGDIKRKRISNLSAEDWIDRNRCTLHKCLEQNYMHEEEYTTVVERHEDPREISAFVDNQRKSASVLYKECEQGSKKFQFSPHAEAEVSDTAQEKEAMAAGSCCINELNGCIQKDSVIGNGFSTKSPGRSMLGLKGGSEDAKSAHVAGLTNSDFSMEEPQLKRCHRSNGKQWRCRKNASPGTLYCELHHAYIIKYKRKQGITSVEKPESYIQTQKANIGSGSQMELQVSSGSCPKQLDVERCHRSDGKLWQCSKQVMQGSIYCENHHNWRSKRHKAKVHVAGKNKAIVEEAQIWAVDNGANARIGVTSCENGHVTGAKELEEKALTERSEGPICTRPQSYEDGCLRKATQLVQIGEKDGLVSGIDGWKQNTITHASISITSPEGKKSVHGFGQFTEMGSSTRALQTESRNISCSQDTNTGSQGNPPRWSIRCCRNDGKRWQCSQLCMPGSAYCEHHQGYLRKVKARAIKPAKVKKMENQDIDSEAFSHKFHYSRQAAKHRYTEILSSASSLHHKQQVQKETKQLTDKSSQDVSCLKRCQRNDGKGWQCSQHAKQGYSLCERHIAYSSKRKLLKLYREENQLPAFDPAFEDKMEISTALKLSASPSPAATLSVLEQAMGAGDKPQLSSAMFGLASCRRACPSDSQVSCKQGILVVGGEPLPGKTAQSSTQNEVIKDTIRPLEGSLLYPSAIYSTHYSEDATNHNDNCGSGKTSGTVKVATTVQDLSSGSSIVQRSIQKQKVVAMGIVNELNGSSAPKKFDVKSSIFEVSPPEMTGCSGGVMPGFVASRNSLQEKPKLERCHRTNGKQWRCSRNATPGTLYCKPHHAYMSKSTLKLGMIPGEKLPSCIQREKFQTSISTQVKLQRLADCCLEQSFGAFQEDSQLDSARCRRTDGRFWQCSKKVMPGLTYCQNHSKRRMKKQKTESLIAGKNIPDMEKPQVRALDNGANLCSGESFSKHKHSTGLIEDDNGLDQSSIQERNLGTNVLEVCGKAIPTSMHAHEDGSEGHADGFVDDTTCSAGLVLREQQIEKETKQLTHKNSQIVCSSNQCQIEDGKRLQCSQHAKQGCSHCDHHGAHVGKCNLPELYGEKENLTIDDNMEMPTADGTSCRKACFSASPSILKEERSAGEEPY